MTQFLSTERMDRMAGQARSAIRTALLVSAVAGVVLGVILLVWPGPTLLAIGVLFGLWLLVSGIMRISVAITSSFLPAGSRWLLAVLGAIVAIGGVLCLFRPGSSLVILALFIGISWIVDGATSLLSGRSRATAGPRWLYIAGAAISMIAGVMVLASPALALATFAMFGGVLLIIVGVVTLCTLPPVASGNNGAASAAPNRVE